MNRNDEICINRAKEKMAKLSKEELLLYIEGIESALDNMSNIIDKAIEYIEWNLETNEEVLEYLNFDGNFNRLLSILRGEDSE